MVAQYGAKKGKTELQMKTEPTHGNLQRTELEDVHGIHVKLQFGDVAALGDLNIIHDQLLSLRFQSKRVLRIHIESRALL